MKVDLATLNGIFAASPFVADIGIAPIALDDGKVTTELVLARRHTAAHRAWSMPA